MKRGARLLVAAVLLGSPAPGAAGSGLLDAAAAAEAVVVGRAGATERVDRHGRAASFTVERVLSGAPAEPLRVAWEDLAPRRQPRLPAGARVLLALDPLPGQSLWRERFPDDRPLVIAARGAALRVDPDPASLAVLAAFLALPAEDREGRAGVPALVGLVAAADEGLAEDALARLDAMPGLAGALEGPPGEQLAAAVLRDDRPPQRGQAILALAGRRRLRVLLPAARAASAGPGPLQAAGWRAVAEIEGGLDEAEVAALVARDEPALRAVGARWLRGDDRLPKLRSLLREDPDGGVRASALRALGADATDAELVESLADPDARVIHVAFSAIETRGEACVVPLVALVESGPEPARPRALAALARIPEGRLELERIAREHPDPRVRRFAELALGRLTTDSHR